MDALTARDRAGAWLMGGLAAVLAASAPLLSTRYTVPWDAQASWLLALRWFGSALRRGEFGDYFPHVFSGYSIGGQPELGGYNVLYLAIGALFPDSVRAINVLALVLQCLQFAMCFRLARQLQLHAPAASFFGLSVMASGFWVGHAEHFSYQAGALSLTMLLSGLLDASAGRARAAVGFVAGGVYLLGTAGYPALMLSVPIVAGLVAVAEGWRARRRARFAGRVVLAAALGGVAAIPALAHFLSALSRNYRGAGLDSVTVMRGSLPLYSLANLFWPGWRWANSATDISMDRFHLLCVTPWAVAALVWLLWRRRYQLPDALAARLPLWSALALLFLILSLGSHFPVPLRAWMAEHLLLFRLGRWPGAEYIFFVQLVLALAGAAGVQGVASRWRSGHLVAAAVVAADFLLVMFATRGLRIVPTPAALSGTIERFKVVYGPGDGRDLRRPRFCDDTSDWMIDQTRLAPAGFDWWGYMALVPDAYTREHAAMRWALCSGYRLWDAGRQRPIQYTLLAYMPSRVSIRLPPPPEGTRLLWAETVDPYWYLLVDGQPAAFEPGPAALRYFRMPPPRGGESQVDMVYRGPLSRFWRRATPVAAGLP